MLSISNFFLVSKINLTTLVATTPYWTRHVLFPSHSTSLTPVSHEFEPFVPFTNLELNVHVFQPMCSIDHVSFDNAQPTFHTLTLSLSTSPILFHSPFLMPDGD